MCDTGVNGKKSAKSAGRLALAETFDASADDDQHQKVSASTSYLSAREEFHAHAYLIAELNNIGTYAYDSGQFRAAAAVFVDALRAAKKARLLLAQAKASIGGETSQTSFAETIMAVERARQKLCTFTTTSTPTSIVHTKPNNKSSAYSVYTKPLALDQQCTTTTTDITSPEQLLAKSVPRILAVILYNLGLCHHVWSVQSGNARSLAKALNSYRVALQQIRDNDAVSIKIGSTDDDWETKYMAILNNMGCILQRMEKIVTPRRKHTSRHYFQMISKIIVYLDNESDNKREQNSTNMSLFELNVLLASQLPSPAA